MFHQSRQEAESREVDEMTDKDLGWAIPNIGDPPEPRTFNEFMKQALDDYFEELQICNELHYGSKKKALKMHRKHLKKFHERMGELRCQK